MPRPSRLELRPRTRWTLALIPAFLPATFAMGNSMPHPPSDRNARSGAKEATAASEQRERGRYLVENVAACFMCHGELDLTKPDLLPVPGTEGAGTSPFPDTAFPWLNVPNITPDEVTGAGTWTDDQLERAIRRGVGHDGRTLFPMMPYALYSAMSDEDVGAVIQYLRSIPAVRRTIPPSAIPQPILASLRPLPEGSVPVPGRSATDQGEYLTRVAACAHCHSPVDARGVPIAGMEWSGGLVLDGPWGRVASANLTPDVDGISYYDEALFLRVMRTGNPGGRELRGIMPWGHYSGMTDEDLTAIFGYLRSLPPVSHRVDNQAPPTSCARCGGTHGLGDRN